MRRALEIVATAVLATLLIAATAEGAILTPSKAPKVNGPLVLVDRGCERTQDPGGPIVSCRYFYRVDPASDGDPNRDYGVIWTQVKFVNRGCARSVWARERSTPDVRVHRKAPAKRRIKRKRTRPFTTRLRVRAAAGQRIGSVSKRFKLRRGTLSTTLKRRANGRNLLRQAWRGPSCPRSVGLVYGAEYSLPAGELASAPVDGATLAPFDWPTPAWDRSEGSPEARLDR